MTALFCLAVDVGTSRTAAATARISADGAVIATPFTLGRNSDSAPSVVYIGEGELLFGDAAARRGIAQPERLVREFKRRIGDDVPILAGDQQFLAEQLYARMVSWVIEAVVEREGCPPAAISVTVPVTWTDFRTDLVRSGLAQQGWPDVELITEPMAAARHYESDRPLSPNGVLAVYDLGGGTFDAVVLRKDGHGDLGVAGEPVGLAAFGGSDFDDIVLRHTLAAAGLAPHVLAADPAERIALAALRRECVEAKEALSFDSDTVVPVLVGDGCATVRLTRSEFEEMIENGIAQTVDVLAKAFDSAAADMADVEAILLTGGSSRIPRVAQLLSERFDRPIAIDADPKAIIALGAARTAIDRHRSALEASAAVGAIADTGMAETAARDGSRGITRVVPAPRKPRKWFGLGPAIAVTGGTLMLSAGIVASVGFPLAGSVSSDLDSQQGGIRQSTPASQAADVPAAPGTDASAGYELVAASLRNLLTERSAAPSTPVPITAAPSKVPVGAAAPTAVPLLAPAPPSDRIRNLTPIGQDATSIAVDAPTGQ